MYDFALHQNTNSHKKTNGSNKFFSAPQKQYWLNNSVNIDNSKKHDNGKKYSNKAISLFVLGIGLLFISKGVQKKSKSSLEKVRDFFENRVDKSVLNNSTHRISFYDYFVRRLNSYIRKSESINNFNSLKDILFMKFMHKTKPTRIIHQGITKLFEHISRNTVIKSYKKTQKKFDEMHKNFDMLDDYILKNHGNETVEFENKKTRKIEILSKKQLVGMAKNYRAGVKMVVDIFTDEKTQNFRYQQMKNSTSKLYSEFWNQSFKGFWTKENKFKRKEMWQTFIASEQIRLKKADYAENVALSRKVLSYSDAEKKSYISEYIDNINRIIPIDDTEGISIIKRLKWYTRDSIPIEKIKESFLIDVEKLEKHDIKTCLDDDKAKMLSEDKNKNINLIKNIVIDSDEGELKDMLDIYRVIAPFELTKSGTLNSVKKATASFDKSINLETIEMYDKLRDLEIGSAPTDILTILISTAMIIRSLEKTDNKREKSTIMLKSGIPIAGAIMTSLISATKLVSGSKSIALGFISGIILNRIGTFLADKHTKTA